MVHFVPDGPGRWSALHRPVMMMEAFDNTVFEGLQRTALGALPPAPPPASTTTWRHIVESGFVNVDIHTVAEVE